MILTESKPSALIIAPKRSGTNYTHDILAPRFDSAVNEPLGLHNDTHGGKTNPLDPWNFSSKEHVSHEYGHVELADDPLGSLLTRSFLGWIKEGNKLIKETDFLHLGWLLASVPLKIIVIRRDPRESIASFKKYGLFHKWGYQEKMQQFSRTIQNSQALNNLYGGLTNFDEFTKKHYIHQLSIYYAIALLEIARNTENCEVHTVSYEYLVNEPHVTFEKSLSFLGLKFNNTTQKAIDDRTANLRDPGPHGTFRAKKDLTHFSDFLSESEEKEISAVFSDIGITFPSNRRMVNVNFENNEAIAYYHELLLVKNSDRNNETNKIKKESVKAPLNESLLISQKLITNQQYAYFLSWLINYDIPLSLNGKPIFYNDRPQGRIRRQKSEIKVEKVYFDHPVNFVNWIGAAAYCAWVGGRLPYQNEWRTYICPDEINSFNDTGSIEPNRANTSQFYSDTTPVTYFMPNSQGIYDALGNMSTWLQETEEKQRPFEQNKAGLEWNHAPDRGIFPSPRPYWLGTSGLGIRPVFNEELIIDADELYLAKLRDIINSIGNLHHEDPVQSNLELFKKIRILQSV